MLRAMSTPACAAPSRPACSGATVRPLRGALAGRRSLTIRAALDASHAAAVASSALDAVHHFNLVATLGDAVPDVTSVSPSSDSGPFDFLADALQSLLVFIDDTLEAAHVPYSYGFAIITLTVLVKLATFPLSQQQVKSSVAVQALQPRVKELQARYAGEPETLQIETARLYKEAGVNPLAGCLPTLATIPIFIGLYKALSRAADQGLGQESFFWIPDLSGPTTLVERTSGGGLNWLFPFVDGHPPIGWGPAGAYLIMPALLVASQYLSMKIIQPPQSKDADQAQQQTQAVLQFLPLMIGWFSLNVPSGLTLYWFVNNILSTGQQLYLKRTAPQVTLSEPPASTSTATVGTIVKPKEERVKKVAGKDFNARRSSAVGEVIEAEIVSPSGSAPQQQQQQQGSRGKSKGEKFRALKAKEASSKAAAAAAPPSAPSQGEASQQQE